LYDDTRESTQHFPLRLEARLGDRPRPTWRLLAALITQAAKEFSLAQHREVNQADLITLHQEFISACVFGPTEITVTVISRGRQHSTLRIQLFQHPSRDRTKPPILRIEALVHQSSLARESASGGLSLPTHPPSSKWPLLDRSTCIERKDPPGLYERRTAYGKVVFMLGPETNEVGKGVEGPSVRTQWIRWRNALKCFDDVAVLAYLAATHRPLIQAYDVVGNWFPALNMSLDLKKGPPEGGWEWLFMRIEIHSCEDGRFDYDVIILDEQGDDFREEDHQEVCWQSWTESIMEATRYNLPGRDP
jgi:hypothetical protein